MYFSKSLMVFATVATYALAAPVEENALEKRTTVTCTPSSNSSPTKNFVVNVEQAQAQAGGAGFTAGKSGDPHGYGNGDKITWGVNNCDNGKNGLYEYPVYWTTSKTQFWDKDSKTSGQAKTPIRVVYANVNGGIVYCGVMTHSGVDANYQGTQFFQKCT